jgi:hypothetical protein
VRQELIDRNVAQLVQIPKQRKRKILPRTSEEVRAAKARLEHVFAADDPTQELSAGDTGSRGSRPYTRHRTLARALSTRARATGVTSSSVRHTVGAESTRPEHTLLAAQGVDVGDRLTASSQHRGHIHPHLATGGA